jgi:hypothetical protein
MEVRVCIHTIVRSRDGHAESPHLNLSLKPRRLAADIMQPCVSDRGNFTVVDAGFRSAGNPVGTLH